jgi:hypothetical protein
VATKAVSRVAMCAVLLSLALPISSVAANSAGSSCRKAGALSGTAKRPLVCRRVKGKLVWKRSKVSSAKNVKSPPSRLSVPLTAQFSQTSGIVLMWGAPVDATLSRPTAYRAQFQTSATPWLSLQDWTVVNSAASIYSQAIKGDGLNGMTLRFRVAAVNAFGVGEYSESNWVSYSATSGKTPGVTAPGGSSSPAVTIPSAVVGTTTTTTTTTTTLALVGTVSQRNAVAKGASYLRSSSFSRTGLIEQLQYEGFSLADATYGTDAQGADWNAQAVKKGASYLRSSSFSRSGLISQLQYEDFSLAEATYGTDAQGADWNAQAAKKAASYLRSSSFSRSGLLSQLLYEGFSQSEAEYGVSTTGL